MPNVRKGTTAAFPTWVKKPPVLTRKERMGSRVERVGFEWERGKVRQP